MNRSGPCFARRPHTYNLILIGLLIGTAILLSIQVKRGYCSIRELNQVIKTREGITQLFPYIIIISKLS